LKQYSKKLADRNKIIALSKSDLLDRKSLEKVSHKKLFKQSIPIVTISSAMNEGIQELLDKIWGLLDSIH
jgi:GTP-binding protein